MVEKDGTVEDMTEKEEKRVKERMFDARGDQDES